MPNPFIRIRRALIVACAFAALFISASFAQTFASEKPNIIFILADDLGYGDLGSFGQRKIKTPHLDRMAREGMKLTDFYSGSTVCAPARGVLMTGLHTGHARVRGNGGSGLLPEDVTVAEVLKKVGYATALTGKWGLGREGSEGMPTKQGFDYFFGYLDQVHAHNYYPEFLVRNEQRVKLRNVTDRRGDSKEERGGGWAKVKVDYSHDVIANEALSWIDGHRDEPFFLYLALTIPHANNEAGRGLGDGQEVPDYGIYAGKDWPNPDKGQAAMITRMDKDIGRIIARLKNHGIDKKTLVIFTSDNGHHKEGGNDPEFFDANGPLRGMKRDLYEGGIRVPTIARWPGKIAPGSTSDHVAYFGDFMATAAELAGVKAPTAKDSLSFLPALLGRHQESHEHLYWEFHERGFKQAIRQGKWKAVRLNENDATIELFNLATDLGETKNLASSYPEIVNRMAGLFRSSRTDDPAWRIRKPKQKTKSGKK